MSSSDAKTVIKATDHPNSRELPGLLNITLEEVAEGLQSSKFTSVDIVKAYLARIEESNVEFRSVIEINPDAVRAAELLDEERHRSGRRGYWHGVPILIKDNIVTQDRMEATSGSCALVGAKPDNEASVVSKFRKAGAVILGKTNLSEWANFRSEMTSNGWSPRGGQTMGTYYPKSQPSGSSAGSGVATSLGLCVASLGSETAGSIICPAEINCIVGLKPTRGLVANDGCVPISHRQDVVGPMTRTVRDAAHMLNILAGRSEADDFTWNIPFDPIPDFTASCQTIDLNGVKIGVPRNTFIEVASPILAAFEIALTTLAAAGAEIIENTDFESVEEFLKQDKVTQSFCIAAEFKSDLAAYFAGLKNNPHNIHNMKDLITYTQNTPEEQYPDRDVERFLWTQKEGADVSSAKYKELMEKDQYFGGVGGILGALKKHNLDILAVPSTLDIPTLFAAKMGFPILSVPLGFYPEDTKIEMNGRGNLVSIAPGIPFCITFITKAFDDAKLLRVGYAFEQITKVRLNGPKPFKVPKTELRDVSQRAQKL